MESLAVAGRALRLRRNLSYALVALAASFGGAILTGCAGAEGEEETEVAEADIDVALFSSYKDYASPDDAGPVWFGNSMNAEGSKHTTHAVRGFGTISEPVISYPTGKVTSSNTGTVGLMPGRYGVLVQFLPKGGRRGALGTVKLLEYGTSNVQRPTRTEVLGTVGLGVGMSGDTSDAHARSDGFYRGYFRFELGKGKPKTYRIVVESNGSTGWETGLVSLHREGRPFFAIAHNPDSIEGLEKALEGKQTGDEFSVDIPPELYFILGLAGIVGVGFTINSMKAFFS